jgi:hypothetical protein
MKIVGGVATSERSVEPVISNGLISFDLIPAVITISARLYPWRLNLQRQSTVGQRA